MIARHSFRRTVGTAAILVWVFVHGGCCATHSVQVVDLITGVPVEGVYAGTNPNTLAGLLGGKLDTLASATTDARGHVEIESFCDGSHHVDFVDGPNSRFIRIGRFKPNIIVENMGPHMVAARQAVERWLKVHNASRQDGRLVIPLLSGPAFIKGVGSLSNDGKPDFTYTIMFPETDDAAIVELRRFPNARFLIIGSDRITDAGLAQLADYPRLMSIDLFASTGMTPAGIEQLRRDLPDTIIVVHERKPG